MLWSCICPSVCYISKEFYQNGWTWDRKNNIIQQYGYFNFLLEILVKFQWGHPQRG